MAQDYNATLNLPKTDFPMRAGLPKREPEKAKEAEIPELSAETRQALYDELFSDCTPV